MTYLAIEGLSKSYGEARAVDALDLTVEQGEFVSLLGPSGCGKTTTLQMLAGFVEPTAGRAVLAGADLLAMRPNKRGLGIVFQSYALFPHATAAENVAFGLEMRGVAKAERETRVRDVLALVGLSGLADRYPKRMSGGQQQRVALARALVIRPSILLLDEPLSNLDAKLREEMQGELRSIQRRLGTTTILVTHDQHEAMALSDRIVVMNAGRVEQIARPEEAYERPASAFVARFLGRTNSFPGRVSEGAVLIVAERAMPVAGTVAPGDVTVTVRPERLRLVGQGEGLGATITSRVFQGAHWLFTAEGPAGAATLIRPNDGSPQPAEGEAVRLGWRAEDALIERAEARG